ncbi:hypothetical protein DAPPUDRAFT_336597 [Daphnia pulex]|uniref:Uncharacterized protein n=1 Tax=Daphnia pulex TaxID=6669 RepID=E9HZZ5_DAPPU|nr:hypothetical protein DAPPUDRAFT_336597 [Daphnia pulex]|eukprot:EFX62685.1 hypothetical protein DAPPUDRAFT_336597 [Daphnia pulex]
MFPNTSGYITRGLTEELQTSASDPSPQGKLPSSAPSESGLGSNSGPKLPWGMVECDWSDSQRALIHPMLHRVSYAFQQHEKDHGFVKNFEVPIDTGDARPVVMPQYRMEQVKLNAGRALVKDFFDMGIIEPSKSN